AFAGLLWSKQFYLIDVSKWMAGDPTHPAPPPRVRNTDWGHVNGADIISMPDKWEYPWFAAWDTAFHCVPFAMIDPAFAKDQLMLLTSENYMHPNGQIPAYEWQFGDVNPPVHAWAAWRVFEMERQST
ncbi:MAG: MGH1-like glycoside hydrolase domain-containing protein, partial [Nostoc sp.]